MSDASQLSILQAKAELRDRMRRLRAALGVGERTEGGRRAGERLMASGLVAGAEIVLVFWSFGAEIPTQPLIEALAARGVGVALPYLRDGRMEAAPFRPGDPLVPTAFGPLEPAEPLALNPSGIDAVVVPGLAFDRTGWRVGYGGGHFDRFLPRLRPDIPRVGFAFDLQLLPAGEVPRGPDDEPVHHVVTEREVVDCRAR